VDAEPLADRLGIGHVVLVFVFTWLSQVRRHEARRMPSAINSRATNVRRPAGFEADKRTAEPWQYAMTWLSRSRCLITS